MKSNPWRTSSRRFAMITCYIAVALILIVGVYWLLIQLGQIRVSRTMPDGSHYEGYWHMGHPGGPGIMRLTTGEEFEGVWNDEGELLYGTASSDRFFYVGGLKDLHFNGYGVCQYKDGSVYRGYWDMGKRQGLGLFMDEKYNMDFGQWDNNEYIKVPGQEYKTGQRVYGVDLSRYQEEHSQVRWEDLALYADSTGTVLYKGETLPDGQVSPYLQPIFFAIMKSTQHNELIDPTFQRNFENARRYGVIRGAYHFLDMSASAKEQAEHFIANTPLEPGDLPPILDIEFSNKTMRKNKAKIYKMAHEWLDIVEQHYGVRPMIYTNESYFKDWLAGQGFDDYDFWIARYYTNEPSSRTWEIWQFTDLGRVDGIHSKTYTDIDLFKGNYSQFVDYIKTKGIQKNCKRPKNRDAVL